MILKDIPNHIMCASNRPKYQCIHQEFIKKIWPQKYKELLTKIYKVFSKKITMKRDVLVVRYNSCHVNSYETRANKQRAIDMTTCWDYDYILDIQHAQIVWTLPLSYITMWRNILDPGGVEVCQNMNNCEYMRERMVKYACCSPIWIVTIYGASHGKTEFNLYSNRKWFTSSRNVTTLC